jgi:aryl-alcohol dehydrogenase-like predicted oxidoreductase
MSALDERGTKEVLMSLDHYVTLGRSGLRVSPLCLGAMTFGEDLGWGTSVEESQKIIDGYIELGGNFIDTANFYTRSHSEKIIGDHVGRHPARRDRLVIATKFGGNLYPGDPNGGGSGRKSIIGACEHSLRRLQTDYVDLTGCTPGTRTRRSRRRWRPWKTWFAPERCGTSACPIPLHGR